MPRIEKVCHMQVAHLEHTWDTQDRHHLRYYCPGMTSPAPSIPDNNTPAPDTDQAPIDESLTELWQALAVNWKVFRKHTPVGAYLPVGQMDGDCRTCHVPWPCDPVKTAVSSELTS